MNSTSSTLRFKFTESSLEAIVQSGNDPRGYLDTSTGIQLRNFGEEITVLGKTKFVAFGENPQPVSTGIKIIVPDGYYASFLETDEILNTSLMVRPVFFDSNFTKEVTVNFFNMGEREVVIPKFAVLPVVLIARPFCKNSELVSDLEYLEAVPNKTSSNIED